jgi:hypothetical protein
MSLSFKKNLKPSMYFIKSFSVIEHIFEICKVYSHHWFLIFIYVSHIWNLKSSTHLFTLNYSTSIFLLCYTHLEVLYQSLFFIKFIMINAFFYILGCVTLQKTNLINKILRMVKIRLVGIFFCSLFH